MDPAIIPPAATAVTVAIITPLGRGALAVVGVAGAGAARLVGTLFRPRSERFQEVLGVAIHVGRWGHEAGEEVVVVRHSAARFEVHCHGGVAAPTAVLESLVARGASRGDWRHWLAAIGTDADELEIRAALAAAAGPRAARILSRQLAGAFGDDLRSVAGLAARGRIAAAGAVIDRLLRAARVGTRLARPWRVVIAGPVNAGKSSLVNALAGHARCLVSSQAGTTRDLVETRLVLDGWEVELVDTAGWRDVPEGSSEQAGIEAATRARADADLVLVVHDAACGAAVRPAFRPGEIVVVNKVDLVSGTTAVADAAARTSALTGAGIADLAARIVTTLVPEAGAGGLLDGGVPCTGAQVERLSRLRESLSRVGPAESGGSALPRREGPDETR